MQSQSKYDRAFSFEFFPPKTPEGKLKLRETWKQLGQLGPKFFSVTFGAGGSTQAGTLETVTEIRSAGYHAAPHLSCVASTREELKAQLDPDLILTHTRHDLHQDHRLVCELTWNTWRNHLILEYEVPKYDGDLGSPSVFVPLNDAQCRRKIETILASFPSQAGKRWFSDDLFRSLMRLRGMECNAADNYAEAFYCKKLVLG